MTVCSDPKLLPSTKVFQGTTYQFRKLLGRGTAGEVGLYQADGTAPIVIKANYCGDRDGETKGAREDQMAKQAAAAVGNCPTSVSRCAACSLTGEGIIRVPLSTEYVAPCSLSIYPYFHKTLADWLADTAERTPAQVVSLFKQLIGIVLCLGSKGYYYTDLKPANFLVSGPMTNPRLTIGDLGGLDTADMKQIVVTPGRLPHGTAQSLDVSKLDQVTAYLLGSMALELIVRPSRGSDASHPVDGFFDCLRRTDSDSCVGSLLGKLSTSLVKGLNLSQPRVRDLIAAALTLLGYRGLFLPVTSAAAAFDKADA
jgi:serine/threonine protein kinase